MAGMGNYGRVHLMIVPPSDATDEARMHHMVVEGRFGCDYDWNDDFTAYRCLPHRWMPGSDSSYAAYQAGYYSEGDDEGGTSFEDTDKGHPVHQFVTLVSSPWETPADDDGVPF
jgi:hypothetical protein